MLPKYMNTYTLYDKVVCMHEANVDEWRINVREYITYTGLFFIQLLF